MACLKREYIGTPVKSIERGYNNCAKPRGTTNCTTSVLLIQSVLEKTLVKSMEKEIIFPYYFTAALLYKTKHEEKKNRPPHWAWS